MEWSSADAYTRLMMTCRNTENVAALRSSVENPTAMVFGTDSKKDINRFTIEKFSHLQQDLVEVISFEGYRSGHTTVQVGQYMYILGGQNAQGDALNRVSAEWPLAISTQQRYVRRACIPYAYQNFAIVQQVQRVNIRNWTVESVQPMQLARVHFAAVHLDGFIYAIGANFDASSMESLQLSTERYVTNLHD